MHSILNDLPVEILQQILRNVLCPGIIAIQHRGLYRADGKQTNYTLKRTVVSKIPPLVYGQRQVRLQTMSSAAAASPGTRFHSSRYLAYQVRKHPSEHCGTNQEQCVVDCNDPPLTQHAIRLAEKHAWCSCVVCHDWEWGPKPKYMLGVLVVCRHWHDVGLDLLFSGNVFHLDNAADLEQFLSCLTLRQRSRIRKVQVARKVLILMDGEPLQQRKQ